MAEDVGRDDDDGPGGGSDHARRDAQIGIGSRRGPITCGEALRIERPSRTKPLTRESNDHPTPLEGCDMARFDWLQ
jgi:hypothetical protein